VPRLPAERPCASAFFNRLLAGPAQRGALRTAAPRLVIEFSARRQNADAADASSVFTSRHRPATRASARCGPTPASSTANDSRRKALGPALARTWVVLHGVVRGWRVRDRRAGQGTPATRTEPLHLFPTSGISTRHRTGYLRDVSVVDECEAAGDGEQGVWAGGNERERRRRSAARCELRDLLAS